MTPGTLRIERKVTFDEEVDYWCQEFPDLSREDIAETLKAHDEDIARGLHKDERGVREGGDGLQSADPNSGTD